MSLNIRSAHVSGRIDANSMPSASIRTECERSFIGSEVHDTHFLSLETHSFLLDTTPRFDYDTQLFIFEIRNRLCSSSIHPCVCTIAWILMMVIVICLCFDQNSSSPAGNTAIPYSRDASRVSSTLASDTGSLRSSAMSCSATSGLRTIRTQMPGVRGWTPD